MENRPPVTVLYDEGCTICTRLAARLARHDGVHAVPIGSVDGDLELRDLTATGRYAAFHAVDSRGRRRTGGAAVPLVLRALPGGAVPAALAAAFPQCTELAYRLAAGQRGRLSRLLRRRG